MAYMKIYCDSCGGTWDVYRTTLEKGNRCPHCDAKISRETWKDYIAPMLDIMNTAAVALRLDHSINHGPLFAVSVYDDSIYQKARKRYEAAEVCEDNDYEPR